ncbi:hypothetical protein TNCV_1305821 [Trichonephila clavipes]|nr:hypothetical protein TNCV_1305821 [Trichonephila clavipes]
MGYCKQPSGHKSLLERLGEERWKAPYHPKSNLLKNRGGTDPNCIVNYMVLKATANDKCTTSFFHDEFREPQSDTIRQVSLATTTFFAK